MKLKPGLNAGHTVAQPLSHELWNGTGNEPAISTKPEPLTFNVFFFFFSFPEVFILFSLLQETEGQKTNNGIQYRLQLLYANGEFFFFFFSLSLTLTYLSLYRLSLYILIPRIAYEHKISDNTMANKMHPFVSDIWYLQLCIYSIMLK